MSFVALDWDKLLLQTGSSSFNLIYPDKSVIRLD